MFLAFVFSWWYTAMVILAGAALDLCKQLCRADRHCTHKLLFRGFQVNPSLGEPGCLYHLLLHSHLSSQIRF